MTEQTNYRWRKEQVGMKTDQANELKELEKESTQLSNLVADLALDKAMLQEIAQGNLLAQTGRVRRPVRCGSFQSFGEAGVQVAQAAESHAAVSTHRARRRAAADAVDHRARVHVWTVRVPAHHGAAPCRAMHHRSRSQGRHRRSGRERVLQQCMLVTQVFRIKRSASSLYPHQRVAVRPVRGMHELESRVTADDSLNESKALPEDGAMLPSLFEAIAQHIEASRDLAVESRVLVRQLRDMARNPVLSRLETSIIASKLAA